MGYFDNIHTITVLVLVLTVGARAAPTEPADKQCGYQSCNPVKDDMLNVHIVPHTHDDVGWLKTFEGYYKKDVNVIISSVVKNLKNDMAAGGDKKFIYVEMAFLKRWWMDQNENTRQTVRDLVNDGRLQIILGGWCMNDEATPYYEDIIDQHTLGFEFIRLNLGQCGIPTVGWQIDPFGHSREQASLFAQFGFDGMFVGRIDYQDIEKRKDSKTMQMIWQASDSLGASSDLFLGVMEHVYWPPDGFCWDYWCSDTELVNSDERYSGYIIEKFLHYVNTEASHYTTNHIMITMGSDFQYRWADKWYENLDKLIQMTNKLQTTNSSKVNLLYSTPACYLQELHRANQTWTTKKDDLFPYAHRAHSYWTGYFTSRPLLKGLVRTAGAVLQSCKQMDAFSMIKRSHGDVNYLKEAMGVVQHHDGVSGTAKQFVTEDYERLLWNGIHYCQDVMTAAMGELLPLKAGAPLPEHKYCTQLHLATCDVTETNDKLVVTLYNPLGWSIIHWVRIPTPRQKYRIVDGDGNLVEYQAVPISDETMKIPQRLASESEMELVFSTELPPLGISVYFISRLLPADLEEKEVEEEIVDEDFILDDLLTEDEDEIELAEESFGPKLEDPAVQIIQNKFYVVTVARGTGRITRLWNKEEEVAIDLDQDFLFYTGYQGSNYNADNQASGAYIFRPNTSPRDGAVILNPVHAEFPVLLSVYKGQHVQEIRQTFCHWVSQVIRLYTDQNHVELEWTVGPLPSGTDSKYGREGKEVISRYNTDLTTEGHFYTDLNGRETLKRTKDHRDTWDLGQSEPEAGNYYPVTTRAAIRDERRGVQLTVLIDRSEGGASLKEGSLELMVHRRTFSDDSLGVSEPLEEPGLDGRGIVVRGKHYLTVNKVRNAASVYRPLQQKIHNQPATSFVTKQSDYSDWIAKYNTEWSGLRDNLPVNIHLLTLELWTSPVVPSKRTCFLLRLEHIFEKYEDETLSDPEIVSLQTLFKPFTVVEAYELTLGANQRKETLKQRFKWRSTEDDKREEAKREFVLDDSFTVELVPMEIRTFQICVDKN